jgi:hypothetical protein
MEEFKNNKYNIAYRILKKLRKKIKKIGWKTFKIEPVLSNVDFTLDADFKDNWLIISYNPELNNYTIDLYHSIIDSSHSVKTNSINKRYSNACPKRFDKRYRKRLVKYLKTLKKD